MRLVLALTLFVVSCGTASAEIRTFVLNNDSDGYGVDQCLASGASCGVAVASAYCRSLDFADARSFRKVASNEVTGGKIACVGGCGELVAIECTR